ncbi:MAG: M48 family metallopeptidase [Tidjanibacter sp.]|nr:M48 family metallopeptidase [Tidjanibacter sp.]
MFGLFGRQKVSRTVTRVPHPRWGSVEVVRSGRAKRISLSVRADATVRLTLPPNALMRQAMTFLESREEWVERARAKVLSRYTPDPRTEEERVAEREQLRAEAKRYLPKRVAELSAQTGLRYGRLSIRASRTRWGSCSARNDINLSLYLMKLPPHLIDYVILHELCHTRHKDHSERFNALLDSLCGGRDKELSRELRNYRPY